MPAHNLVAKFADLLPLYRQSIIYPREGIDLDRALLASWVGAASALLRPLVDAMRRHVLAAKLHADDTPIPVSATRNGKTKTARLWIYVGNDPPSGHSAPPAVRFTYTPDHQGIHPQTHLAKFKGVLQADAHAGLNALFEDGTVREAPCWGHARRKFHDLHAARLTPLTTEVLRRIAELYVIEAEIRVKPTDEQKVVRQFRSRPLLDALERRLRSTLDTISRKSDTAVANLFVLELRPAPLRYCDDSVIKIDNSAVDRVLRGVAIGRRNYLFAGADSDGERAAAIYSLIGTAKLRGVDPETGFRHVLTHIADHPVNRVDGFLPWNCSLPAVL